MTKNNGFTLIELMVALAIFGILIAVAAPSFTGMMANFRLKQAMQDIYSNFQLAKTTAIKTNSLCTVTFNQTVGAETYDYVVYIDADGDLEYDAGEQLITRIKWSDYKDVSFDTGSGGGDGLDFPNNDDGLPTIAFRSNGIPMSSAGGVADDRVYLTNTFGKFSSLVVSAAGSLRIE